MVSNRKTWKALTLNYEAIMNYSDITTCYQLSDRQVAMLLSQTSYLYWFSRWETNNVVLSDYQKQQILVLAAGLEYALIKDNACEGCADYGPASTLIDYAPNDPFLTPNDTPAGYLVPPWYNNPAIPIPGVLPTDAMVNFLALPGYSGLVDLLATGFPRFTITATDATQLEIEFVRVPQGGLALITINDDPVTADIVNLDSINIGNYVALGELIEVALEPALVDTFVHEINFTAPGQNYVTVTFLPNLGEAIILGFGGGIRRITLCGEGQGMNDCCYVYKLVDGVLYQSSDDGITFERVDDGGNGPWNEYDPAVDGNIFRPPGPDDNACQSAWNAARVYQAFHIELSPYFQVGAIIALALTSLGAGFAFFLGGGPLAYAAISGVATAALAIVGGGLVADDFDETIVNELVCIFVNHFTPQGDIDQAGYEAALGEINAKSGLIWDAIYAYVSGMGIVGLQNAAFTQSVSDPDCVECCMWEQTFDFTSGDQNGWIIATNEGSFSNGFIPSYNYYSNLDSYNIGVYIKIPTDIEVRTVQIEGYWNIQDMSRSGGWDGGRWFVHHATDNGTNNLPTLQGWIGNQPLGGTTATPVVKSATPGTAVYTRWLYVAIVTEEGYTPGQSSNDTKLQKITLKGKGINPWTGDCDG